MRLQCNKFDTDPPSCRFYAFPFTEDENLANERVKVHVDGEVDFRAVVQGFKDKGVDVTVSELRAAYKP